ncbi:MAG: hypothetical protein HYT71_00370 [Candidatus Aenigmarchaeota archaeon]|nr:hypothetical protein [Candidatus Aenigmarchaeota archaeon]
METSDTIEKGITVTIRDRVKNRSKSFTVYSDDLNKVYKILKDAAEKAE